MSSFFHIEASDSSSLARAGLINTYRGAIQTPTFMPVGTKGSVKAAGPDDLRSIGAQIILANAYHLNQRPGEEVISSLGGLSAFMGWSGPIITDSGGYQVFSLKDLRKITEEGVCFRSTYDGAQVFLSPEKSISIQEKLGVDILMCLDECTTYPATRLEVERALNLTFNWAKRSLKAWSGQGALFGICQGGFYPDLRQRSAEQIASIDFPGQAIGGLALGEEFEVRLEAIEIARQALDPLKPIYLMGLGTPRDLIEAVRLGADLFDCVLPTRNARNGQLFTRFGRLNILNSRHKLDPNPVDENCQCLCCRGFSRAYLRHLHQNREPLYLRLATIHNLSYYLSLLSGARKSLIEGTFPCYYKQFFEFLCQGAQEGYDARDLSGPKTPNINGDLRC
ncbi:MAG: tRNA guanosine(34) transglycosylase Tgt [Deltaproteobacteria bacterium]|jgi:queuine tRNA-ribosyltransferase|nr:tRNA guanosine(34) transglycosylase Tgt [Deltaproteobacteria bacterium]